MRPFHIAAYANLRRRSIGSEWRFRIKRGRAKAVQLEILNLVSAKTSRNCAGRRYKAGIWRFTWVSA